MVRKADMQAQALDHGLRGLERRHRPRLRPVRAGPRSARACGRCPTGWPTCSSRRSRHPKAGANCAWVPSPDRGDAARDCTTTASTSSPRQAELAGAAGAPTLDDLLTIPLAPTARGRAEQIAAELDNNAQGILGYVVRWVDQGVGCSKVPDINDVGADGGPRHLPHLVPAHRQLAAPRRRRATSEVEAIMRRMAAVVDRQNAGDPAYRPMAPALRRRRLPAPPATSSSRARRSPPATPNRSCTPAGWSGRRGSAR